MPQLDPTTFATQLFWLLVTFSLLYLVVSKVILPRISGVLQNRQDRMDDDLEKAEKLKSDAEAVLSAYEKTIAEGRSKAQAIIREEADKMAAEAAARQDAMSEKLKAQTAEAESRIDTARQEALANIRVVAAEVAKAASEQLIGGDVSESEAQAAVTAVAKDQN
jgi:F-type H+-transporting ATPase subunit b